MVNAILTLWEHENQNRYKFLLQNHILSYVNIEEVAFSKATIRGDTAVFIDNMSKTQRYFQRYENC